MSEIQPNTPNRSSRTGQAKELIDHAGQTLKAEAQSFAHAAQGRVRAEAQKGTQAATKTLGDFANAVRRAGDDLEQHDQSPASRLVRQAADGLESLSRNLADKEPGDLLNAVRDFGRKNPAAFIGGAVLVGLALGRFARATEPAELDGLSDADLTLAETQLYEGLPTADDGSLAGPVSDDLGDLRAGDDPVASLGAGDATSGIGGTDAAGTSPSGGR